jgi:hypothetical protein
MAITNFIAEIWASQMLMQYWEETVFAPLVNRDYEGELQKGNQIHIAGVVPPAIKDYATGVSGARTTAADPISDTGIDLLVDQERAFDFYVDDIDRAQAAGSMDQYTAAAGLAMGEDVDQFIAATLIAGATAAAGPQVTTQAAAGVVSGDEAFDIVADVALTLNKAHVPKAGRVLAINSMFHRQLVSASSKLTEVNVSGDPQGLRNATVGMLLGFRVIVSENLPQTTHQQVVGFNSASTAFVSQIQKVEAMRAQDKFADRLRGLQVHGCKVIKTAGTAAWTATS